MHVTPSCNEPNHYRLGRLGVQRQLDLYFGFDRITVLTLIQFHRPKDLEQPTEHVLHLHISEISAKADARTVKKREEFPSLWLPALPTIWIECVGVGPDEVVPALERRYGQDCMTQFLVYAKADRRNE
jgi:hypothetical protein